MRFLFLIILTIIPLVFFAQSTKNKTKSKLHIGLETGYGYFNFRGTFPDYQSETYHVIRLAPEVGFQFLPNFTLGFKSENIFQIAGNIDYPNSFGVGYFLRFFPWKNALKNPKKWTICENCVSMRMRPYFEVGHFFSSRILEDGISVETNSFSQQDINFTGGLSFRLRKDLFYQIGFNYAKYLNTETPDLTGFSTGLEYYFGFSKLKEHRNSPECNSTIVQSWLDCLKKNESKKINTKIILGTSLTYIWDDREYIIEGQKSDFYQELTWNINAAVQVSPRFRVGASTLQIFTKSQVNPDNQYFLVGGFTQLEPFIGKKRHFHLEAGLFYGNYCTCEPTEPYREDGLFYWEVGVSGELPLHKLVKGLYLDLGFNTYRIFNDILGKYEYTQYVIGLNYMLGDN